MMIPQNGLKAEGADRESLGVLEVLFQLSTAGKYCQHWLLGELELPQTCGRLPASGRAPPAPRKILFGWSAKEFKHPGMGILSVKETISVLCPISLPSMPPPKPPMTKRRSSF